MGFVRHALGKYGEDIVSLAAQDYFFESGIKRAFFENLTNLKAIDRKASLRQAIRQASEVIERGKTVLVFPEGTRSAGGRDPGVQAARRAPRARARRRHPARASSAGRTRRCPRGRRVPTKREILARIGPPLARRRPAPADRGDVARGRGARGGAHRARGGARAGRGEGARPGGRDAGARTLAPEREHPLVKLFAELEAKFRAGEVAEGRELLLLARQRRAGEVDRARRRRRGARCGPGKPEGGQADCVLKTSPEIFAQDRARVVRAEPGGLHVGRGQVERRGAAHDLPEGLPAGSAVMSEYLVTGATGLPRRAPRARRSRRTGTRSCRFSRSTGRRRARRASVCAPRRRAATGRSTAPGRSRASPRTPRRCTACTSRGRRPCSTRARRRA